MKKKILVVDNHPVMLKFMNDLLSRKGHQVVTAKDGLSALDVLKTFTPDIIFVDLIMPNIEGKKLCQVIRANPELKNIQIVIISAVAAEEEINLTELGADACIAKGPFNKMTKNILTVIEELELKNLRALPGEILVLKNGNPREITKELIAVKKHFEMILESMSEGIIETTSEGRIVYANSAALSLSGEPEEKLLGSNFISLFLEPDHKRIKNLLKKLGSGPQQISEESPITLNGHQVTLDFLPLELESPIVVIIINDVTERKRMEAQLLMAQKMEAIGTLAGGIAHDFNNLLMGIMGNTSLLLLNTEKTHPHYEMLRSIERLVKSGARLTRQLLGYARKGRYEISPINLNQLVEETSETFGRTKKEITIHRELSPHLFTIEADQGQIEQVLLNLYVNAADAMPKGGGLYLKTMDITHKEMKGKLYKPKPGNYVLLTITDTGMGMDEETLKRIFEPFFTTKELGKGTGLGLASVYGIIKGHGGYIDVESKKGQGTTFMIYLPATKADYRKTSVKNETIAEIPRTKKTILLVDDEEFILKVSKEMLESIGYQVLTAKNGKEAVKVYQEKQGNIDMVILDMVMPDMSGGKVYDLIKKINPHIKVLLSSGYSIDGEATQILNRGCNGFIQKPFSLKDLSLKIKDILEEGG